MKLKTAFFFIYPAFNAAIVLLILRVTCKGIFLITGWGFSSSRAAYHHPTGSWIIVMHSLSRWRSFDRYSRQTIKDIFLMQIVLHQHKSKMHRSVAFCQSILCFTRKRTADGCEHKKTLCFKLFFYPEWFLWFLGPTSTYARFLCSLKVSLPVRERWTHSDLLTWRKSSHRPFGK